jgi:hypothetical protein
MIIFFYVYRKTRESSYLIEIIVEIHFVNIFKLMILIAIDIVNIKKIFINFRIRTLAINIILKYSTKIRTIYKNIKIIRIVINYSKEKNFQNVKIGEKRSIHNSEIDDSKKRARNVTGMVHRLAYLCIFLHRYGGAAFVLRHQPD